MPAQKGWLPRDGEGGSLTFLGGALCLLEWGGGVASATAVAPVTSPTLPFLIPTSAHSPFPF